MSSSFRNVSLFSSTSSRLNFHYESVIYCLCGLKASFCHRRDIEQKEFRVKNIWFVLLYIDYELCDVMGVLFLFIFRVSWNYITECTFIYTSTNSLFIFNVGQSLLPSHSISSNGSTFTFIQAFSSQFFLTQIDLFWESIFSCWAYNIIYQFLGFTYENLNLLWQFDPNQTRN